MIFLVSEAELAVHQQALLPAFLHIVMAVILWVVEKFDHPYTLIVPRHTECVKCATPFLRRIRFRDQLQ